MRRHSLMCLSCLLLVACDGVVDMDLSRSPDAPPQPPVITQDMTPDPEPREDMVTPTPEPDMAVDMVVVPDMPPEPPEPWVSLPTHQYARKIKFLLHGGALTADELKGAEDRDGLRTLVRGWVQAPPARAKLQDFFIRTFQQDEADRFQIVSQLRGTDAAAGFFPPDALLANLEESFARTAMRLVERGEPFTGIADTDTWVMTTGMMSFMLAIDSKNAPRGQQEEYRFYHEPFEGFDENTPLAQQNAAKTWYLSTPIEPIRPTVRNCADPYVLTDRTRAWSALFGRTDCTTNYFIGPFEASDLQDWRPVRLTKLANPGSRVSFADVETLRGANRLALSIPRAGYFTTPAFLSKWRTNIDNSFRVTTNQTLIVGLGKSFESENFTAPLTQDNLGIEHADPTTVCYGCHVQLDPMRNFFALEFDPDTYEAIGERPDLTPSFGFVGLQREGTDLRDLGKAVAEHPLFAEAWLQKMCMYANSQECDVLDPEFKDVERSFIESNYDFETLLIELFSSSLITLQKAPADRSIEPLTSITRRSHLCHALNVRLGVSGYTYNACANQNQLSVAIPNDEWTRGAPAPFQPATSSLFYAATIEGFCDVVARQTVDKNKSPLQSREMEASIEFLVHGLIGLPTTDPRAERISTMLTAHVEAADAIVSTKNALISATTLACSSPLLTSVDF